MTHTGKEWLLLIHQIPPKPSYFRVKVWRRLQQVGAIAVKQSVYALPNSPQGSEDFAWISREILEGGGEVSVCEARFLEGLTDEQVVSLFQKARKGDYEKIIQEVRALQEELEIKSTLGAETVVRVKSQVSKLKSKFNEIAAIDFFSTPERSTAEILLADLDSQTKGRPKSVASTKRNLNELKGRVWVTRENVYVDRIACAWLIRRFVDSEAKFKFVPGYTYTPKANEVRFDMYEGEYTQEGVRCTFEVMVDTFAIAETALIPIAEIVHDLELKDNKFERPEAAGLGALVNGVAMAYPSDKERVQKGGEAFDALCAHFQRVRQI
jgi:hypothetical protein